ncbi:MAG: pentapeptide repeat-containing protein [Roseovarius sp.]|nr:pentapeptide repeat-containing protein [Roseovarius sp.]
MKKTEKPTLRDWLGFATPFNYGAAPWLGRLISFLCVAIVGGLFVLALASAFGLLFAAVFGALLDVPGSSLGVGGVTVALIGAPFVIWRSLVAQKTLNVTEQGHITDRINIAVQGLGAEKSVKRDGDERPEANLEVRIGSIYALERLSQDSERDHIQIMEILCAYIRMNAGREDIALPEGEVTPEEWRAWAEKEREHVRLGVDVALKVIERRDAKRKQHENDKGYRLGLERAQLRKIILSGRDLTGADLSGAQLQGADLWGAKLQGADLKGAELQGAFLRGAELQGADLLFAQLQGADLGGAKLQGANLSGVDLQGAAVRSVDFTDLPNIWDHLAGMFGDGTVILPDGHGPEHESWPKHWPRFELDTYQFDEEWKKWQANPEGYVPPEPPEF